MNRNFKMSRSILPRDICRGPRWEFAVNSEIRRRELNIFAIANKASATSVGCHMSQDSRGLRALYWRKERNKEKIKYETNTYIQICQAQARMIFSGSFSTMTYWQEADVFHEGGSTSNLHKNKKFTKGTYKGWALIKATFLVCPCHLQSLLICELHLSLIFAIELLKKEKENVT